MPALEPDKTPSSGHAKTRLLSDGDPSSLISRVETHPTSAIAGSRQLQDGDHLGEYVLRARIGRGGMGEVWRAEHARLGREVALKLMLRWTDTTWARFEREARLAAGLDHPHIAKLFEFSQEPPFIAMQLIGGSPIAGASQRSIRALRDAALAVEHAHQRGVLHRDLKPDNIAVDDEGNAFVLDFGLAVPVADEAGSGATPQEAERLTLTGEVVGTPAYMAPEQARGDAKAIGRCSDVYGLGATLYALLAGHPPFSGSGAWQILRRVVDEEPMPPGGDRDLETICLCAMAKDPRRRYPTAKAFADDLGRWLAREPVRARRAGLAYRLTRSVQRRPAIWGLGAALLVALAAGGAFGVAQLARANLALSGQLAIERQASAAQMARAEQLELEGLVESARADLRALDDELARELDPAHLEAAFARVDALAAQLARAASRWPNEGIVLCLAGHAALLRNREDDAITAYDHALAGSDGPVSAKLGARREASLGRAVARLRRDYLDLMGRLFILNDQSGYLDQGTGAKAIQADLDAAGTIGDADEREVLALWARYLRAAADPDRGRLYVETHDQVVALAERGGRHDEYARVLCGILTGPQRTLEAVAGQYTTAITRSHSLPQAWLLRALEYASDGKDAQAKADCDQALRLRPDYLLARLLRAQVDDAHPDAERADADAALALAPTQPQCWLIRSRVRRCSEPVGAIADLRTALQRAAAAPNYRGADQCRRELGGLLAFLGRRDEAVALWAAVGDDEARLAQARLLADDPTAAEAAIAPLLIDAPLPQRLQSCASAREQRAQMRARVGDHEAALADWRWLRAHAPNFLTAGIGEGEELACLGKRAEAIAVLDLSIDALRTWARGAQAQGVPAARANAYVAEALLARGRIRVDAGDAGGARADCDVAFTLNAQDPEAFALRARLVRAGGDATAAAADEARRVALLVADGDTHRTRLELADAEEAYRKAVAVDATSTAAQAGLAALEAIRAAAR